MTVSSSAILKGHYDQVRAQGDTVVTADFALEIVGHEGLWLRAHQCPWPVLSPEGEIEIPAPLGTRLFQPQQANYAFQGPVSFLEVRSGAAEAMLVSMIENSADGSATFDAKIYEGTPQRYLRYKPIYNAFIQVDPVDRDWESRGEGLRLAGTMFYHYFGEIVGGNSTDYR